MEQKQSYSLYEFIPLWIGIGLDIFAVATNTFGQENGVKRSLQKVYSLE